ncbi:MAG: CDP-alcohol phosphatidyltransferase [Frankiales bacterium]|nr:CDP-alcohol phosphatidyltransferase [Frankiales bacterium]
MLNALRPAIARIADAPADRLLRWGVSPDAVTLAGTVGVVVGALALVAQGNFFWGTMVITVSVLTDMLDGAMARKKQAAGAPVNPFGGWLDSTCDRAADAAVFGALVWWFAGRGDDRVLVGVALFCLVAGAIVSYAKARAEGLGLRCDVGLMERSERLVLCLLPLGLVGIGAPDWLLAAALWLLAVTTAFTVVQRALEVRRQAALSVGGPGAPGPA